LRTKIQSEIAIRKPVRRRRSLMEISVALAEQIMTSDGGSFYERRKETRKEIRNSFVKGKKLNFAQRTNQIYFQRLLASEFVAKELE